RPRAANREIPRVQKQFYFRFAVCDGAHHWAARAVEDERFCPPPRLAFFTFLHYLFHCLVPSEGLDFSQRPARLPLEPGVIISGRCWPYSPELKLPELVKRCPHVHRLQHV